MKTGRPEVFAENLGICGVPCGYGDDMYFNSGGSMRRRNFKDGMMEIIEQDLKWMANGYFVVCNNKVYCITKSVYEVDPKTLKIQVCSRASDYNIKSAFAIGNKIAMLHRPQSMEFNSKYGYITYTTALLFDPATGVHTELLPLEPAESPVINVLDKRQGKTSGVETMSSWTK